MLDYKKIGLYLLEKRKLHNLTQKQLANQLNISFQAVSRWESGMSIPSVDLLQDLAKLFQITVDEILKGEDKWPTFSYQLAGVDVSKIDLMNNALKDIVYIYQYNPAFRGAAYPLDEVLPLKSLQIVSKVQEPVTKQRLAIEYGYLDELIEDIICTLINDILMIGAKPLFITSSLIVDNMDRQFLEQVVKTFDDKAKKYQIKRLTGQCAIKKELLHQCLISSTITGILDDSKAIDTRNIRAGDVVLAIGSNGIHHYGYSLIDSLINTFPQIKKEVIDDHGFIDEIMKVQFCYYDCLIDLFDQKMLKGAVNISGCGFPRNLKRVIPEGLCAKIDLAKIVLPKIFHCLKAYLKVSDNEMLNTFNCGVGYLVIVSPDKQETVMDHINQSFPCYKIGEIKTGTTKIDLINHLNWN